MIGGGSSKTLAGKLAVVTGGSSGIGQYTARGLARQGAHVVITARNAGRLAETASWLRVEAPGSRIETEAVDFAALQSVRALAQRLTDRHPGIDILVNNAGLVTPGRTVTADGFEATMQINHLAPFLLTNLLLPAITLRAPSRVVTVASEASKSARLDFDDLQLQTGWGPLKAYGRSKLMNILFTYALARRLAGSAVTANCLHPGFVATRIGNKGGWYDVFWAMLKPLATSPEKGAQTSVWAATDPGLATTSGQYFAKCAAIRSNPIAYDVETGERLWQVSAKMVGIAP